MLLEHVTLAVGRNGPFGLWWLWLQLVQSIAAVRMSRALHFLLILLIGSLLLSLSQAVCPGTLFIKRSATTRVLALAFDGVSTATVLGELLDTEPCTSGLSSDGELFCCLTRGSTNLHCWNLTLGAALVQSSSPLTLWQLPSSVAHSSVTSLAISKQAGAICAQPTAIDSDSVYCVAWPQLDAGSISDAPSTSTSRVPNFSSSLGTWFTKHFTTVTRPVSGWTLRQSDGTSSTTEGALFAMTKDQQSQLYTARPLTSSLQDAQTYNINIQPGSGNTVRTSISTAFTFFLMDDGQLWTEPAGSQFNAVSISTLEMGGTQHALTTSRCSEIIATFISSDRTKLSFTTASVTPTYSLVPAASIFDFPASWLSKSIILPGETSNASSNTATPSAWNTLRYAWGSNVRINPILIYGSDYSCEGPNPDLLHFSCVNGNWVSDGDVNLPNITIGTTPVLINGSFTSNGTLIFTGSSSVPITILACLSINSSDIVIYLTSEQVEQLAKASPEDRKRLLLSFNQTICDNAAISLSTLTVQVIGHQKCDRKVSAALDNEIQSKGTLSAVFNIGSANCKRWWIPLVAVVGGILLVVLILALIFTFSNRARECIRPYSKRNREY